MNRFPKPPTSRLLLLALRDFIASAVTGYPFPSPEGKWLESAAVGGEAGLRMRPPSCRDCRVFLHGLPEGLEEETYPFVLIRWTDGDILEQDTWTVARDTVSLILGVHSPRDQEEAGLLLAELLDLLRRAIWKERLLCGQYQQAEAPAAAIPDPERRVHKYHLATIKTVWEYLWPSREQAELTKLLAKQERK